MKKILLIIVVLSCQIGFSQSVDELFEKGNSEYQEGNYEGAIESYLSIEQLGVESDDLFYNLGNCYYKLDEVAPTIYYYEKALKLNPIHEDAQFNLEFAKRMTIDVIEDLPKTFLQRFSDRVIMKLPYDTWAIIAIFGSILASLLFLLYHFSYTPRKKLFYFNAALLSFFILVISVVFAFTNYDTVQKNRPAIIFAPAIEVKNAPSAQSEDVFELHEGTKVMILDDLDDWKKIKLSDGKIGWLKSEHLMEI